MAVSLEIDATEFENEFRRNAQEILRLTLRNLRTGSRRFLINYYKSITPVRTGMLRDSLQIRYSTRSDSHLIRLQWNEFYANFPIVRNAILKNIDETYVAREYERILIRALRNAITSVAGEGYADFKAFKVTQR